MPTLCREQGYGKICALKWLVGYDRVGCLAAAWGERREGRLVGASTLGAIKVVEFGIHERVCQSNTSTCGKNCGRR